MSSQELTVPSVEAAPPEPRRLSVRVRLCEALGFMSEELVRSAYQGSPLAQRSFPTWESYWEFQKALHADLQQIQITLHTPDGSTVGGIVLCPVLDALAGESLMALHTFILPAHRSVTALKALRKEAREAARRAGYRWIIYPRGTPEGVLNKYQEV